MTARGRASRGLGPSGDAIEIGVAATADEIATVRELLLEYEREIRVDLCFQGFAAELDRLPGEYASPHGRLLIARSGDGAAGCIALRPLGGGACEMKRLYVRPSFRATGLGRVLAERILGEARTIGYTRMCLDTLPAMARAQSLYEKLGFRDVPPYRESPIAGTRFMGLDL